MIKFFIQFPDEDPVARNIGNKVIVTSITESKEIANLCIDYFEEVLEESCL